MGVWGYLHRAPTARLTELLASPEEIADELYPCDGVERLPEQTVEKTWNAIEFILDRLADSGRIPQIGPLTEGEPTGAAFDNGDCWYRTPEQVRQIAEVLGGLSRAEFRRGYLPELMAECNVYPAIWDRADEVDENFEYIWGWYAPMVEFYRVAATAGDGMLLHLA